MFSILVNNIFQIFTTRHRFQLSPVACNVNSLYFLLFCAFLFPSQQSKSQIFNTVYPEVWYNQFLRVLCVISLFVAFVITTLLLRFSSHSMAASFILFWECSIRITCRPRWSRGNVLASRSKVRGFKSGWGRWIFSGRKIPEHNFSGKDFKLGVHSLRFQAR